MLPVGLTDSQVVQSPSNRGAPPPQGLLAGTCHCRRGRESHPVPAKKSPHTRSLLRPIAPIGGWAVFEGVRAPRSTPLVKRLEERSTQLLPMDAISVLAICRSA